MQWNERFTRRAFPALAAALLCATGPASATTYPVPAYKLPQPDAPIRITGCAAGQNTLVLNTADNVLADAGVDYHNKTAKRIIAAKFAFYLVDARGHVRPGDTWNGGYNYPVQPYGDRVWTHEYGMQHLMQIQGGLPHTRLGSGILCTVSEVDFADGSAYRAPLSDQIDEYPGPYQRFGS